MYNIEFYSEKVYFDIKNKLRLCRWIYAVAEAEGRSIEDIVYIFCGDDYLYSINMKYLKHDTYTDIITFDYCHYDKLDGEIYISVDRVRENAKTYKTTFAEEILRVIIHGILHLIGYKDKTDSESAMMREKENHYIAIYNGIK